MKYPVSTSLFKRDILDDLMMQKIYRVVGPRNIFWGSDGVIDMSKVMKFYSEISDSQQCQERLYKIYKKYVTNSWTQISR